jgi:hypothetical protein
MRAIAHDSILQAKTALELLQRDVREVLLEPLSGQIVTPQGVQVPKDGLAHIEGLAPTNLASKVFEPPLNLRWQTHGNHRFAS